MYYFDGENVFVYRKIQHTRSRLKKRNTNFIFQSFNLIDTLSVYKNVELLFLYPKVPKNGRKEKILGVLKKNEYSSSCETFFATIVWSTTIGSSCKGVSYKPTR